MSELVQTMAAELVAMPNRAAWAEIETRLALAGVPRRDWMRTRDAVWAQRKQLREVASKDNK